MGNVFGIFTRNSALGAVSLDLSLLPGQVLKLGELGHGGVDQLDGVGGEGGVQPAQGVEKLDGIPNLEHFYISHFLI